MSELIKSVFAKPPLTFQCDETLTITFRAPVSEVILNDICLLPGHIRTMTNKTRVVCTFRTDVYQEDALRVAVKGVIDRHWKE